MKACPGVGDDTLPAPLPFFSTPDFIGSQNPNVTDDTPIDLVFVDFIEPNILSILNSLAISDGLNRTFSQSDVQVYSPILGNQVLGVFAEKNWN